MVPEGQGVGLRCPSGQRIGLQGHRGSGPGVGLQGPRRSRGRPTGSQAVKG